MSVFDKLEKWRDGTVRYVERYSVGTKINGKSMGGKFKPVRNKRFTQSQKVGVWNKEPQQKIVLDITHGDYVDKSKGEFYRASISLNVPYHGTHSHPNYINFTYVVVDELKNIDMNDMYEEFIQQIEDKNQLGYSRDEFTWFDSDYKDCDVQLPKPYSATKPSNSFEGI